MINNQPIEKRVDSASGTLDVHSIFHTIQGEGPFAGRAAVFIRLAGCNLQCPGCDTDYTSTRLHHSASSILETVIMTHSKHTLTPLVVITGGEPFRQNIHYLVAELLEAGYTVQIETNGTLAPPTREFHELCSTDISKPNRCFIVCSPKTGKVNASLRPLICAYKYVLTHDSIASDGLPLQALGHTATPFVARPHLAFTGTVYVQPCDSKDETTNARNVQACIASVMERGYTLQLQTHKILGLE